MKRKTTKQRSIKKRIKIDISDWELADWPNDLLGAATITKTPYSIDIEISAEAFESAARKIIKEGLETYFKDANWWFQKDGLEVCDLNHEREFMISFNDLQILYPDAIAPIQTWLDKYRSKFEEEDKQEKQ